MHQTKESPQSAPSATAGKLPVTIIIPVRNDARNLRRCLLSLEDVSEVLVVDSQSTDDSVEIAREHGAQVAQFHYHGGWPKKRQWAMDTLPLANDWILLLDADEVLTPELKVEMRQAIQDLAIDGYSIALQMWFLGRTLQHCDASFFKLSLFRRGKGRYECRLAGQDASMADMEVHEHVVVDGPVAQLRHQITHHNVESLFRYIQKHNEYSNWEARVLMAGEEASGEVTPCFFGTQAQRRRWLKLRLFDLPGSPLLLFLYRYVIRLGFLDGVPGLIYCGFQAVQMFHTKAKIYELRSRKD